MSKGGFHSFLAKQRRSEETTTQCILFTSNSEDNLAEHRHSKGMEFDMCRLKHEDLEEIMGALNDLEVDVVSDRVVVRVFCRAMSRENSHRGEVGVTRS
jgi:hypothetical protein